MPVTARNGGKRKSRNLKRKMLKGSAKKVLSKRYTRRKMRGGMKYIPDKKRSDLIYIWNSFLYDRLQNENNYKKLLLSSTDHTPNKYALFVIDMQNDFVDAKYNHEYNEMYDTNSTPKIVKDDEELNFVNGLNKIGNFNVAQGNTMWNTDKTTKDTDKTTKLQNLIVKINDAYNDPNCKCIIFSRDYHPVDHMSFSGEDPMYSNYKKNKLLSQFLNNKTTNPYTGNFPAHCIECHSGSSFIPILITDFFNNIQNDPNNTKVKIVFKGIHPDIDSFSAVGKDVIDSFASNMNVITNQKCNNTCSNVTGGYIFKDEKSIQDNVTFLSRIDINQMEQAPYDKWLSEVDTIEVCGLAGDYCVRDTICALAEKYTKKQIILLQDLTRYAHLPVFTIDTLPEHKSQTIYLKNDLNLLKINPAFYREQLLNTDINIDKGINYYIFKDNNLLLKEDIDNKRDNIKNEMFDLEKNFITAASYTHFITNHKHILDDYSTKDNIKILLDESNLSKRQNNK